MIDQLLARWPTLRSVRTAIDSGRRRVRSAPPKVTLGGAIVALLGVVAIVGPLVTPYDPATQALRTRLAAPSLAHPLGTDELGRDVATRLVYGARLSLGLALLVTAIRLVVGTVLGLVAGLAGGIVDASLMRLVDVQLAFPGLILALVVAGILGPGLGSIVLAISVVGWASYARVVRGSVLSVKNNSFVQSSKLYGTPRWRIAGRHLLPNVMNPVIVLATLDLGTVVISVASLSFLGVGAQPPTAEWGMMVNAGRDHLRSAWWLITVPGVAIMLTVIGFNLLGDGLRDLLDPDQQALEQRRRA
ncbi:nickel transporter permease [Halorhabdus rudnickae]|uniref:nickel transporter permease n=1 Tax=Halorhabdus rudnickae TaxID=1775544 RepID=UPI001083C13B